ncbi:NADH-quinone oxidoreductase subunit N [Salinibacter ruber]|uniref:NADH-quinone oxidoreductase subunit N n=1 Tax=Salinibacter ruber TaxID=146919 RepID=A0AAW5P5K3_9BACT|nr:NADH-quinone oxidoreductase subunit N [Salinibacter ruber]MCS3663138.1 NADH-quinone oxidoreductase subunit N [Salinibacter ruber]MCS3750013.1 NADH-quinone oxidoreductase subunit N [Salinibacter ruber]MCS4156541.1 NADH-quinone oxidoreductase subunit N [Salinibacter ruber]MCS4221874.1 NADH-quinone oxidoreductase subunit N [Salinibacter ruber]
MDLSTAFPTLVTDLPAAFSMLVVGGVGLAMIVLDAFRNDHPAIPWLGVAALGVSAVWEITHLGAPPSTVFFETLRTGGFVAFINLIILLTGLATILLSVPYLNQLRYDYGEVYALIMFCTVGMIMLGSANNMVSIFLGLETMSVCLYVLTGFIREDEGAVESALKYFLLGAFSTGFFLYGIALMYGATGTMALPAMAAAELGTLSTRLLFWGGFALFLVGFFFKVSAAPFHMWTPDVYQGAPTPLTGYMSTATKAAAFAALILVLVHAVPGGEWQLSVAAVAVLTMVIGNVMALAQTNVKRLLAYSSIAHAGYLLVGLSAGTSAGYAGALFYLLVYAVMNIGAFGVMSMLEWDGKEGREQTLSSLAGIANDRPVLGSTMGVFMLSLIGFPPLGGFIGKYLVFAPAVDAGLTWLVVIGVLMSALSAYYYLRVVYVFWMQSADEVAATDPVRAAAFPRATVAATGTLVVCAVALVVLGVFFGGVLETTLGFFETTAMATAP